MRYMSHLSYRSVALLVCALLMPVGVLAGDADVFQEGIRNYDEGHFEQAITIWEKQVAKGIETVEVFYNLGCAYFRTENLPKAIWNFERALKLAPGNPQIKENLELAQSFQFGNVPDEAEGVGAVSRIVNQLLNLLTLNQATILSLVLYFGLGLAGMLFVWTTDPALKPRLVTIMIVLGVLLLPGLLSVVVRVNTEIQTRHGILLGEDVELISGPKKGSAKLSTVKGGVKVQVQRQVGTYFQVFSPRFGAKGWVHRNELGLL